MLVKDGLQESLSSVLASFVVSARAETIPKQVMAMSRLCVLDWVGSALAGARETPGEMILELVQEMGGTPHSTLIATGEKTSVLNAALVNGAMSHIVELDDLHKTSILHPAAPIIPAALAVAEMEGKSGNELLLAVALGYETAIRIGEAVTPSHYNFWHTTATCGTFGAAAAAGKLLGLTKAEMIDALGTAGTQAAGLWEFIYDGAMSKHLHPGKAAQNGVLAALLAKKGFTGASRILEGEKGFFRAMSEGAEAQKIVLDLGSSYKILENSFKIHASCRHTHPTIDLIIGWHQQGKFNPEEINNIKVETYQIAVDIAGHYNPTSIYAAKFSIPFCAALAAVKGKAGLDDFSQENLNDPLIRQVMGKINLSSPKDINDRYPVEWPARIKIEMANGQVFNLETSFPKGDPENMVSIEEIEEKFRRLVSYKGELVAKNLLKQLKKLEEISDLNLFTVVFKN